MSRKLFWQLSDEVGSKGKAHLLSTSRRTLMTSTTSYVLDSTDPRWMKPLGASGQISNSLIALITYECDNSPLNDQELRQSLIPIMRMPV